MINYESEADNLYLYLEEYDEEDVLQGGSPYRLGGMNLVLVDDLNEDGYAVCRTQGKYLFDVTNEDSEGDPVAVTMGKVVYINDGALNFDETNGTPFGFVLGTLSAGVSPVTSEFSVVIGQFAS